MAEHVTNLYIHEVALHNNQGNVDLNPQDTAQEYGEGDERDNEPSHVDALQGAFRECLQATHSILDAILSIQIDVLLTLPVIYCNADRKSVV